MWFYFLVFSFLLFLCLLQNNENRLRYYYFAGFLLILIAGFRSEDICRDYAEYRRYYEGIKSVGNIYFIEPTFSLITIFTPGIVWLMLIYATLAITIKLYGIKQLTEFYFLSLLLYFSGSFILHEMTQIRVGVSAGLLLLCIEPIYNRKFRKFILISFTAALFHYSALIFLPLYFLKKDKLNKLLYSAIIPLSYLLHAIGIHITSLLFLFPTGEAIEQKLIIQQQAMLMAREIPRINVFNILQLLRIVLISVFLWKTSLLQKSNKYFTILFKTYIFSIASFVLFANIPVFSFRLSELMGIVEIILVPMVIYILKPKFIAYILCVLFAFGIIYMSIIYGELLKPYF